MLSRSAFRRLCSAREMLRETQDQPISIRDIAHAADMSPFHFIRQFEAVFGATPHQFRIQTRLDRAKHLLALSDYSVTDVCLEVGFSSLGATSSRAASARRRRSTGAASERACFCRRTGAEASRRVACR